GQHEILDVELADRGGQRGAAEVRRQVRDRLRRPAALAAELRPRLARAGQPLAQVGRVLLAELEIRPRPAQQAQELVRLPPGGRPHCFIIHAAMVRSEGGGCPAEDALLSFVDGRGSAEDRARVEQHMDECDDCRAAISALAAASPPPVDAISSAPTLPDTGDPPPAATGGGTLSPGTRLGRYVITALEGKGGMGEVYAAEDPALGRRVAIKVLRRDLSSGSAGSLEERLAREAQAMARLNHPAVVTVYDVGELDGRIFIAMEYVAGQTLAGWLAAEERPWRQVLARFIAAGRGLAAAHAAGLVHRDFKPENVLLG